MSTTAIPEGFHIPTELSPAARSVAEAITAFAIEEHLTHTGGISVFRVPDEWNAIQARRVAGEKSLLVIYFEGAAIGDAIDYDRMNYDAIDRLNSHLHPLGVYIESINSCSAAVYPI